MLAWTGGKRRKLQHAQRQQRAQVPLPALTQPTAAADPFACLLSQPDSKALAADTPPPSLDVDFLLRASKSTPTFETAAAKGAARSTHGSALS
jgi:hypothetical protein